MKYENNRPLLYHRKESELSLSPEALLSVARAVLARGMDFRFRVRGFSMLPFLREGDVVTICPAERSRFLTGDIVAAVHPQDGKLFIHRIVRVQGGCFVMKGDNCPSEDGQIPCENILGKVTRVERKGRRIILGLGWERFALAFISRSSFFYPPFLLARRIVSFLKGKR